MNLLKPRPSRPQQPTPINWAHPRASGLAFFAPLGPYDRRDLVLQRAYTATGNEVFESNSAGTFHKFGTSQYVDFPLVPPTIGASTPFTVAWTQEPRATSAYSTILNVNFGTAGVHNSFVIYLSAADSSYYFTAGPRTPGAAHSWATAAGPVTNGALDRYVLRGAAGSQSTTGSDWTLYRNGIIVTRGTSTTYGGNTAGGFRIGALLGATDVFEGLIGDMRLWSRALSDQEMSAESTLRGALELYAPERIWLPVPVGASTTHTTTGALAADAATVSGAALHPHTTSGALTAQAATVSGAALHPHTTTGALTAQEASVAGSATLTPLPVTHTTTGAMVAGEAAISGGSVHTSPNTAATGGWETKSKPYRRPEPPSADDVQAQREAMGILPKRPKLTAKAKADKAEPASQAATAVEVPADLRGKDLAIWIELLRHDMRHGADSLPPMQLLAMQEAHAIAKRRQEEEDIAFVIGAVIAAID